MSEPRLISPLLDGFAMGGPISDHDGVCCCPAMRENADDKYIVKIISIPASQVQVEAMLLSGAYRDQDSVLAYYKKVAEDTAREAEILKQLAKLEGFTPYENWQIVPKENETGYDLYLIGSYKRSLSRHMERQPMTHLGAVNLGLDMCAALAVCRRSGKLYVDLKPENIYVFDEQTYRIGDLGFIALSSLKYASLPEKYRSPYTAPEITDAYSALNTTIDIYALGLVLYQIYNDGKLPFEGAAPAESFPPPAYADYEMSEIILKACAPDPTQRWQDPMEMGQALVDYMQRNGVNATPIVPLPVQPEEPAEEPESVQGDAAEAEAEAAVVPAGEEAAPEAEEVAAEPAAEDTPEAQDPAPEVDDPEMDAPEAEPAPEAEDDLGDLSFIDDMNVDETSPTEESALDLEGAVLTDEASEILAQADDLIAHEPPAPAVAPDPIEVPMPERILPEKNEPEAEEAPAADSQPEAEAEVPPAEEQDAEQPQDSSEDEGEVQPKKKRRWLTWLILLVLLAGLAFGGYYFYENYYLQPIDTLSVSYADEYIHVTILSELADEELIVFCTDTYGNSQKSAVTAGQASFTDLKPSTQYTIKVEPTGFHKLVGKTEESCTTPSQTDIASFTAKTGAEDGSVILSFTVNGNDPASGWIINCTTEGEDPRQIVTQEHWVAVNGLTPGKEYSFTLSTDDDMRIVGTTGLVHTASKLILAQDPAIISCEDGTLTTVWTVPEGAEVAGWSVRCYDDAGYDQTVEVSEATAVFTGVDASNSIFIDITADGQTQSAHTEMTSDPITVISTLAEDVDGTMSFQWTYEGSDPVGGWIVSYSINGSAVQEVQAADSAVVLEPLIPGSTYSFTVATADGRTVFNNTCTAQVEKADNFDSHRISASDMTFNMLLRPEKENWTYRDARNGPFTTSFTEGQEASFLVVLSHWQEKSRDQIEILYVVRDENGAPVSADKQTMVWNDMWDNGYCELDIPQIPAAEGSYTLEVYFNQKLASTTAFTVK